MKKTLRLGFTMIELLVVMAIIGVLASVMLAGFNPVKQLRRARDTRRIADVKAIATALEQYYADDHGYQYADLGTECGDNNPAGFSEYMSQVPRSSNSGIPYQCSVLIIAGIVEGHCISVELQEVEGNCSGCDCAGPGVCTMIPKVPGDEHFCVIQQQ